jgi:tRNA A-37 threonylcarbamoyl transferase component Bud32
MTSDDFEYEEPTLPPLDPGAGPVCPRCHERLSVSTTLPPRALVRCPRHGLAYVDAKELVESGGDSLLGTTVAGRFTVLGRVGAGSMGAVYRARQDAVGRDVALKIVRAERAYDPETKVRFEREARATSALVSPHTITVFDFGAAEDGSWFLAMELLEGETLGDRLRSVGRVSIADAARFAHEAAASLAEAHEKGIIHRDLKPDNLFLAKVPLPSGGTSETVKVLDFGIAKLVRGEEGAVDQLETQAGTVFGTPRYMSPEQAQGSTLDARTDLYSLGVILYQMLTGRAPFTDDDAVVVMARHIKEPPPAFREVAPDAAVPDALERVVRRALAKRPADRQQSARELAAELEGAMLMSSVVATGTHSTWAAPPSGGGTRSARPGVVLAALLAIGLIGVGGFVVVRSLTAAPSAASPPAADPEPRAPNVGATSAPVAVPLETQPSEIPAPSASAAASAKPDAGVPPKHHRRVVVPPVAPQKPPTKPDSPYGRFE